MVAVGAILLTLGLASCRPEVRDNRPDTGTMPLLAPTGAEKAVEE